MAPLITQAQRETMLENGRHLEFDEDFDPFPVVRLFIRHSNASWLLASIDPQLSNLIHGLCDLGLGEPELGFVSLAELAALRGPLGLRIEQDPHFVARKTLSAYALDARRVGKIVID